MIWGHSYYGRLIGEQGTLLYESVSSFQTLYCTQLALLTPDSEGPKTRVVSSGGYGFFVMYFINPYMSPACRT